MSPQCGAGTPARFDFDIGILPEGSNTRSKASGRECPPYGRLRACLRRFNTRPKKTKSSEPDEPIGFWFAPLGIGKAFSRPSRSYYTSDHSNLTAGRDACRV